MAASKQFSSKRGRIVRVKMTNFVTYDSMECFPGNGLNMVIGPNGSGKSTLLSAIVLGLGGKPSVIGRSPRVEDYIKTGTMKALLEIELFDDEKNIVIERTIEKDGRSSWRMNGRNVNLKEVENKTKSLNIQIDNLCQVLAQDRVQDFARMNKQELLESTQKAVGKEAMSSIHTELKDLQKKQKMLEIQVSSEKEKHEVEKSHMDRLSTDVKKMEKRQGIEREVSACKQKLEILKYSEEREKVKKAREEKEAIETHIKKLNEKLGPYEEKIRRAEVELTKTKNKYRGMEGNVNTLLADVKEKLKEIDDLKEKIMDAESLRDNKLKENERQQQEMEKVKQNISRLRNNLAGLKQMPGDDSLKNKLEKEIEELRRAIDLNKRKEMICLEEVDKARQELSDILRRKKGMEDVKMKRLQVLKQVDRDAHKAAEWVENNRHRFEGNVHLPMIVELDVKNPEYAKYVEAGIGFHDMVAFICESKKDLSVLVKEVKQKLNLRVNVLHSSGEPMNFNQMMSLNELNQCCPGFHGYLIDFVSAPQAILNVLCSLKSFHNIPVGGSNVNVDQVPNNIRYYFTGDYKMNVKQSKYSGEFLKTTESISKARFLTNSVDQEAVDSLNARYNQLQQAHEKSRNEASVCREAYEKDEKDRQGRRETLRQLTQAARTILEVKFQLGQKEKDLLKLERARIDPEIVQEECRNTVKELVRQLVDAQEPLINALKNVDRCNQDYELLEVEVSNAQYNLDNCKQWCKAEQKALKTAKSELEQVNNKLADVKTAAQRLLEAFERREKKKIQQVLNENASVFSLLPNSIVDLESTIQEKLAHAEMLGGRSDTEILAEYKNHLSQVERLKISIERKTKEKEELIETMTRRENEWRADLHELVRKINDNFSRYFKELKCAGEVRLFTGNSEHDYDNYGLRIRVSFRAQDALADLDGNLQSGGERAVATAIYMLSLQELSPVPFRLVDEINQGMDPINERRVYEMLMASTSQPDTPQYFLLTPKLLKDLEYSENMTVMCIFNASGAPCHKGWNLKNFLAKAKQLYGTYSI